MLATSLYIGDYSHNDKLFLSDINLSNHSFFLFIHCNTINKIGEYPFLNIPLFNQSINHLYLVSPCKAAFIPVAISVAFTALSKNESI